MLLVGCFGLFYFALFKLAKVVLAPQKQNEIHKIRFSLKEKNLFVFFSFLYFPASLIFQKKEIWNIGVVYVIITVLVECCSLAQIQYQ